MGAYDDIIGQYLPQAARLIQNVENGLLEIESPEPTEDTAHTMHRAIHALKAGAAIAGLGQIVRLSRKMDTILGLVRTQELTPEQPIIDALWQSLDTLKVLIEQGGEEDNPALVDGPDPGPGHRLRLLHGLRDPIQSCPKRDTPPGFGPARL